MSYDLLFWKQPEGYKATPSEIYQLLTSQQTPDALEDLPIAAINEALRMAFPQFDPEEGGFDTPEGFIDCYFERKYFSAMVYGTGASSDRLTEILAEHGCPLYDPQEDKRYPLGQHPR